MTKLITDVVRQSQLMKGQHSLNWESLKRLQKNPPTTQMPGAEPCRNLSLGLCMSVPGSEIGNQR